MKKQKMTDDEITASLMEQGSMENHVKEEFESIGQEEDPKMSVDEFYEFLLQHDTCENILKKLLATTVDQVSTFLEGEILKSAHETGSPVFIIAACAFGLGWQIAVAQGLGNEQIQGFMMGTPEYLAKLKSNEV